METGEFLSKEQLLKLFEATAVGYINPKFPPSPEPPEYTKLGVLIDFVEIVEAAATPSQPNNKNHSTSQCYSCAECRRVLPTAHLLDLHITEQHDLYFAASVERKHRPMYCCYLEECKVKFNTVEERKDHCISAHKFPANYRFDQDKGKKKQNVTSGVPSASMDTDEPRNNGPTIKAFSFGHQKQRAFNTRPEKHHGKPLENVQALKNAIDDIMD